MIKNENIFKKIYILYVMRLEPTISTLTAMPSIQMAKRDSDGYRIRKINTFHNVCKSKISFTELYEFIRHIHECQFNFVKLYMTLDVRIIVKHFRVFCLVLRLFFALIIMMVVFGHFIPLI